MLRTTLVGFAFVLASCQMPLRAGPKATVVRDDPGGILYQYVTRWENIAAKGGQVEILGVCASGCTLVVAYVPKERLCFGENARLRFHQARTGQRFDSPSALETTEWMIKQYPADIQNWLIAVGGPNRMPQGSGYWTLYPETLWEMGYRKCSD